GFRRRSGATATSTAMGLIATEEARILFRGNARRRKPFLRAARGLSQVNDKTGQPSRRRFEVLRAIYAQRRNVPAYVAVCEQTEFSAQDCLVIALMHEGQDSLWCKTEQVALRIRRGTEMLLDRACPSGGGSTCVGAGWTDRLMRTARGTHASVFVLMIPQPPRSTLLPYTTLFRCQHL